MSEARKKWTIFGAMLAGIALVTWFFVRVADAPRGSSSSSSQVKGTEPTAPTEDKEHEMKMLAKELEKKPGHVPVLLRLAELSRDKGRIDDVVGYLREAVKQEPANTEARLELGRALYDKGDVVGAISETQKILEADPKHVDALYNMGAIYANQGDSAKARSYWTAAVEAAPNSESGSKAKNGLRQLDGGTAPKG